MVANILDFAFAAGISLRPVQRVVLKLIYNLALSEDKVQILRVRVSGAMITTTPETLTEHAYVALLQKEGRMSPKGEGSVHACHLVAGRRSGKSFLASLILAYEAWLLLWADSDLLTQEIAPVQVLLLGPSVRFGDPVFNAAADIAANRCLGRIQSQTQSCLGLRSEQDLKRGDGQASIQLCLKAAVARGLRGWNYGSAVLDEFSRFSHAGARSVYQSVNGAVEALRGLTVTTGTPGVGLQPMFRELYDKAWESPNTLALRIPTWELSPDITPRFLQREFEARPLLNFVQEWGAEFLDEQARYVPSGHSCLDHPYAL